MFYFLLFIALSNAQFTANTKCNSAFCKTCDESGATCLVCQDDFFLEGGNCIHMSEKHCQIVKSYTDGNTLKNFCGECDPEYNFDFDTLTCVKGEEMCAKIEFLEEKGTIECTQGIPGYAIYNTKLIDCTSKNKYCTTFDAGFKYTDMSDICHHCLKCEGLRNVADGYCEDFEPYVTSIKTCQSGYYEATTITHNNKEYPVCIEGNVNDCLTYSDKLGKECTKCINNEWFDGESCRSCRISHCEKCHFRRGDVCLRCEEGYYVGGNGECYELPENCASAESNGKCTSCEDGYILNDETGKCQKTSIANCVESDYDEKTEGTKTEICNSCEKGFYINEEKTQCVKCPAGCKTCTKDKCTDCENKDLAPAITKCVAKIEGCSIYKDDGTCETCEIGGELKNGKCVENGCFTFDANANKCKKCYDGYYFTSDFKCQKCNEICGDHDEGCIYKADICKGDVDGCIEYDAKHHCIDCGEGYERDGDFCVPATNFYICSEPLADGESCGLCTEYFAEFDDDGEPIEDTIRTHQYWPDRWGTCGAGSSFILLSILLLALIAFF